MGWPLLGIRNKFIHQKYQKYLISLISGIINIGYQEYQVPYQIYRVSDILGIGKILGIKSIGYQKYRVSDIRNIGYQKYEVSVNISIYLCPYSPELRTDHFDQSEESWAGSPDA